MTILALALWLGAAPVSAASGAPIASGGRPQDPGEVAHYEPSPAYPFGRRHPDAPVELEQFAFMIGACDCVDEIRNPDGSWTTTDAIWNASWFLNGHAIQDVYWSDTFATTNLRLFDPGRGRWFVHFLRMPSSAVGSGRWSGTEVRGDDGRTLVMWNGSPDGRDGSRLTFHCIDDDGFRWRAETLVGGRVQGVGWKSTCVRRRPGSALRTPAFVGHDPGPAAPFGRRHPSAPARLDELAFLVGAHATETREPGLARPQGGLAVTRYVLNGWGLQRRSWGPGGATSTFFVVDPGRDAWRALRVEAPGYAFSIWDGALADGRWRAVRTLFEGGPPIGDEPLVIAPTDGGWESFEPLEDGVVRSTRASRSPAAASPASGR